MVETEVQRPGAMQLLHLERSALPLSSTDHALYDISFDNFPSSILGRNRHSEERWVGGRSGMEEEKRMNEPLEERWDDEGRPTSVTEAWESGATQRTRSPW